MFGKRLKELRSAKKLSQGAIASYLNISQQAVGKWEKGLSAPDPDTIKTLADYFDVSKDYLLGHSDLRNHAIKTRSIMAGCEVPIIGTVRAGYGALAFEEHYGSAAADVKNPANYFYLIVRGDSMEPKISEGDLALVHKQPDIESGDLAVIMVDSEEATLKRVLKKDGAVILQPFNPAYPTQIYIGSDLDRLTVVGKVVETKTRW